RHADGGGEQVGLRAEIVVHERRVDPRPRRDGPHGRRVIAVAAELVGRRGEDPLARVRNPAGTSAPPLLRCGLRHGVSLRRALSPRRARTASPPRPRDLARMWGIPHPYPTYAPTCGPEAPAHSRNLAPMWGISHPYPA